MSYSRVWREAVDELDGGRIDGYVFGLLCCEALPGAARLNDVWLYTERVLVGSEGILFWIFGKYTGKFKLSLHLVLGKSWRIACFL